MGEAAAWPFLFPFNLSASFSSAWDAGRREGEPFGRDLSVSPWQIQNTSNKF